ncbi:hypothetical protein A2U01_0006376, partial [Trifolium medium]|nr:hypothetical protein [Trifolium medium]
QASRQLGGASSSEIERLKLQASNGKVQALEEEIANNLRLRALLSCITCFFLTLCTHSASLHHILILIIPMSLHRCGKCVVSNSLRIVLKSNVDDQAAGPVEHGNGGTSNGWKKPAPL